MPARPLDTWQDRDISMKDASREWGRSKIPQQEASI